MKVKGEGGNIDFSITVTDKDWLLLLGKGDGIAWGRNISIKDAAAIISVIEGFSEHELIGGEDQKMRFSHHYKDDELEDKVPSAWYELEDVYSNDTRTLACLDHREALVLQLALERIAARSIVEGLK